MAVGLRVLASAQVLPLGFVASRDVFPAGFGMSSTRWQLALLGQVSR